MSDEQRRVAAETIRDLQRYPDGCPPPLPRLGMEAPGRETAAQPQVTEARPGRVTG